MTASTDTNTDAKAAPKAAPVKATAAAKPAAPKAPKAPETFRVPFTLRYKGTTLLPHDEYTVVKSGQAVDETAKTIHEKTRAAITKRLKEVTDPDQRRVVKL